MCPICESVFLTRIFLSPRAIWDKIQPDTLIPVGCVFAMAELLAWASSKNNVYTQALCVAVSLKALKCVRIEALCCYPVKPATHHRSLLQWKFDAYQPPSLPWTGQSIDILIVPTEPEPRQCKWCLKMKRQEKSRVAYRQNVGLSMAFCGILPSALLILGVAISIVVFAWCQLYDVFAYASKSTAVILSYWNRELSTEAGIWAV